MCHIYIYTSFTSSDMFHISGLRIVDGECDYRLNKYTILLNQSKKSWLQGGKQKKRRSRSALLTSLYIIQDFMRCVRSSLETRQLASWFIPFSTGKKMMLFQSRRKGSCRIFIVRGRKLPLFTQGKWE